MIHSSNITPLAVTKQTIPVELLERVNLIFRLESWIEADRLEWIGILQRQIERDNVPVSELITTLDAHLDRWHPEWRGRNAA